MGEETRVGIYVPQEGEIFAEGYTGFLGKSHLTLFVVSNITVWMMETDMSLGKEPIF